jgi:hypothetical protein
MKTEKTIPWTHFMDMHSGGGQKLKWAHIYIEAPEDQAEVIFYNMFGRNPRHVTCNCCGEDYSVRSSKNLQQATAYYRGCKYGKKGYLEKPDEGYLREYMTLEQYLKSKDVKFIYASKVKTKDRLGDLPHEYDDDYIRDEED